MRGGDENATAGRCYRYGVGVLYAARERHRESSMLSLISILFDHRVPGTQRGSSNHHIVKPYLDDV